MVCCGIAGCVNHNRNKKDSGLLFHRFPRDAKYKRKWIQACKRADSFCVDNARVCSAHFDQTDYCRDLKAELLKIPAKLKLKPDAVPHLLLPVSSCANDLGNQSNSESEARKKRAETRNSKKEINDLLNSSKSSQIVIKREDDPAGEIFDKECRQNGSLREDDPVGETFPEEYCQVVIKQEDDHDEPGSESFSEDYCQIFIKQEDFRDETVSETFPEECSQIDIKREDDHDDTMGETFPDETDKSGAEPSHKKVFLIDENRKLKEEINVLKKRLNAANAELNNLKKRRKTED